MKQMNFKSNWLLTIRKYLFLTSLAYSVTSSNCYKAKQIPLSTLINLIILSWHQSLCITSICLIDIPIEKDNIDRPNSAFQCNFLWKGYVWILKEFRWIHYCSNGYLIMIYQQWLISLFGVSIGGNLFNLNSKHYLYVKIKYTLFGLIAYMYRGDCRNDWT